MSLQMLEQLCRISQTGEALEVSAAEIINKSRNILCTADPNLLREQLTRLLCGKAVSQVLRNYADVVAIVLPEIYPMFGLEQHNPHHDRDVWEHTIAVVSAIPAEAVLRWAALLHDIGKPACFSLSEDGTGHFYGHAKKSVEIGESILSRLHFDPEMAQKIITLVRYHDLPLSLEDKQIRRLLRKLGEDGFRQLILLHQADAKGQSSICQYRILEYQQIKERMEMQLTIMQQEESRFSRKDLALNGNDLLAIGLRGREIGAAIEACFHQVCDGKLPNERQRLLNYVKSKL